MRRSRLGRLAGAIDSLALFAALLLGIFGGVANPAAAQRPVTDVLAVMSEVGRLAATPMWPGFDPRTMPTAVYDSVSTYLFGHATPPQGFEPAEGKPGVYRCAGKHQAVVGNGRAKIGEVLTATVVLRAQSCSGGAYSIRDYAGIVIHEQFHAYQKEKHPGWRPNDAYLLVYPLETVESLAARMTEKEAFRRAVDSKDDAVAAGWARQGLAYRTQRLEPLGDQLAGYERELQRFEGISEYIEYRARGNDPLDLLAATHGIAPSGIRDLGYVEGRLISYLLDRLDKGWKDKMESGAAQYPEEILAAAVAGGAQSAVEFSAADLSKIRADAGTAIARWNDDKKKLVSDFQDAPGLTIEIVAETTPVGTRMFEPLAMENLGGGEIIHKTFYLAGNDKGTLRVRGTPCISYMDSTYRITRVTVTGLEAEPAVDAAAGTFKYDAGGVSIDFKGAKVTAADRKYTIEI